MTPTMKITLILVLVGVSLHVVAGSSRQGWTNRQDTDMSMKEENYSPRVEVPLLLKDTTSPLDTKAASSYASKIEDGSINQYTKKFCSEAKLLCDSNVEILDPALDIPLDRLLKGGNLLEKVKDMVDSSRAMSFGAKELVVGQNINMPSLLYVSYPTTSFLPQSLSKLLPFSSAKMPEVLQNLDIPSTSNLAIMMARTLAQCESKSQDATSSADKSPESCVTSLEEMTAYVADHFPKESHISSLDHIISAAPTADDSVKSRSAPTTNMFKVLNTKVFNHSIVCHKKVFPYAIYKCQSIDLKDNMRTYAVTLESGNDGHHINQVALCNVGPIARDALKKKSILGPVLGDEAACHWITDALVWAPATAI